MLSTRSDRPCADRVRQSRSELECPAFYVPSFSERNWSKETGNRHEERSIYLIQIVSLLRQIEVAVANGKTTPVGCRDNGITEQNRTTDGHLQGYDGLQVDQVRRLKELEQENTKLKRLVSELSLEKLVLKDIASGNF